jgi:hypothetical protein
MIKRLLKSYFSRGLSDLCYAASVELSPITIVLVGGTRAYSQCVVYESDIGLRALSFTQMEGTFVAKRALRWDAIESIHIEKLIYLFPHKLSYTNAL